MIDGMTKKTVVFLLMFLAGWFSLSALTIKIGTVAPAGSPWAEILHRLAGEWEQISGGSVAVQIYPGGIAGGESDMIRKMRIGQLQGAALTELGLGRIVPDILALDVPFLMSSNEEFNYVLHKSRESFNRQFDNAGYKLLTWSSAGWVRFFTTKPITGPEDLKSFRLGVPAGDVQLLNTWRNLGFDAIPLPIPDIMTGLQSGMIDAFYAPPSAAVVFEWFRGALYMSAFRVAPVVVGLVINNRSWDEIPQDLRPRFLDTMTGIEATLNRTSESMDNQAISTMKGHGLIVDPFSPTIKRKWKMLGTTGADMVVGKLFSKGSLDRVEQYIQEYQSTNGQ